MAVKAAAWVLMMCLGSDGSCSDDGGLTTMSMTQNQCRAALASAPEGTIAKCISPNGRIIIKGRGQVRDEIDDDNGDAAPRGRPWHGWRKSYYHLDERFETNRQLNYFEEYQLRPQRRRDIVVVQYLR